MSDFIPDPSPATPCAVSVIVPVHNRPAALQKLLGCLARQTLPRRCFEVLVCDDGSAEDLSAVVREYQVDRSLDVQHLRGEHRGPGMARNRGIAAARAPLLAFTDSDCEPAEDWLEQLVGAFTDPAVGLVGGHIDFRGAEHLSGRCVNFLMSSSLGGGGARNPQARLHMKYFPRTGNLGVRTELARGAGGFSAAPYGEDIGFSQRVIARGGGVKYVPALRVLHNETRAIGQVFRDAWRKGRARVRLAKTQRMHEWIHLAPGLFCLYLGIVPLVAVVWTHQAMIALTPAALYASLLAFLAVQGGRCLGSPLAAACIPVYALALHLGYGLGYWAGWLMPSPHTEIAPTQRASGACMSRLPQQAPP